MKHRYLSFSILSDPHPKEKAYAGIGLKRYLMKSIRFLGVGILSFAMLSGCKAGLPGNSSNTGSADGPYTIVTSFYPVYISVINVTKGIDSVKIVNMTTAQTGCLHDYQLRPQDLEMLAQADAFVINGAGMESFLDNVIAQQPNLTVIDASKGVETLTDPSGKINPHVWVSITNTMSQVRNIADGLALLDPKNALAYKTNASLYLSKLSTLRKDASEKLSSLKTRDIITFHEAFPYFAKEFDLNILAVIEREPNSTPTAKELESTIKIVKESGAKALFAEPQYSSKVAQTIADATGAKIYNLDPVVTGESDSSAIDNYVRTMEKNVATLKEALG